MINFEELIQSLILPLVAHPDEVEITLSSSKEEELSYDVRVNKSDIGRVIGKSGHIAQAIRTIIYAGASKEGKRVHLNIDSK